MPDRIKTLQGNGVVISGGSAAIGGVTGFTGGGHTVEAIEDTDLSNANFKTFVPAALKEGNDVTISVKSLNKSAITDGNQQFTITFPNSHGSLVFWGFVTNSGDIALSSNIGATTDVTIKISNLNAAGVETPPVLTLT